MRETLQRIYEEHRQGLFTLALSITRCPQRAEDAVHEAFCRLLRTQPTMADPVAYAFGAVRHAALDQQRALARAAAHQDEAATLFAPAPPDPAAQAAAADEQRRLRDAVDRLPDLDRQTVVLRAFAGLTFDQIAQALQEPLPTVASRYRRALEKLRELLEPERCHA